ncbi:MAG: hypothetical protein AB1413_06985 [Thermodesulfobacteriota bacterium]
MNRSLLTVLAGVCLLLPGQIALGADKHIPTPENQECAECHADQAKVWFDGKHGLMNVKCIVCHGATDKNFTTQPGLAACRGCHADEVAQAQRARTKADKGCFPCHDYHALTVSGTFAKPYHAKGGK